MPVYCYECSECGEFDRRLPLAEYDSPQTCECGLPAKKIITHINFNLVGDDWPSKAIKINGQMAAKNRRLDAKMAERKREAPPSKLVPNVGGVETGTWKEAADYAASQGKDRSSYKTVVESEKAK